MPFMMLLSPRLWLALALAGLLAFTHYKAFTGGKAAVHVLWTAEKLAQSESARLKEKALNLSTERIDREYQIDKKRRADSERRTAASLRDFQTAIAAKPDDTPASAGAVGRGGLERELLGNCATALTELAITAGRLETKVVGLQAYVKDVCLAK